MLTKAQLKKIEEIVRRHFTAFTYEALGERALSVEEIDALKRAGLLRESVRSFVGDSYTLGKVIARIDPIKARSMGFEELARLASKSPISKVEQQAINWASEHVGQYIKGLSDDMVRDIRTTTSRAELTAIRAVQDQVVSAIKNRDTVGELKTALFDAINDKSRDWQRIATTEMHNAVQNGVYAEIRDTHGSEQLVYKKPNPDACKHCKRVYLEDDGVTPRLFKMTDLADTNVGKRAMEWEPTVGAVHPWCGCQLMMVPDNYGFVKKRVVITDFVKDDVKYKKGRIVPEELYNDLDDEERSNVGYDAILEYTGKLSKPTVEKSLTNYVLSDMADYDCFCRY